jgi:dTDP-4-amino-4,6-dideoxygalactose transaminase
MREEDKPGERLPRKEFLVFGKPDLRRPEIDEVVKTMESGWIGTGPRVTRFELEFCKYVGAKHAVAVSSCTAALHLSLLEYGIGPGDEVITSPMTFASTANVIVLVGATPVFVDIDRDTQNIDPALIQTAITPRTKAIIPVHYAGRPCDMTKILEIAQQHGLVVIEDAAHAIGAQYEGRNIGTLGDLTAFSFYVTKNVVTGEGGMLTLEDGARAEHIRLMSHHGISKDAWKRYSEEGHQHYEVIEPSYSYNMTDLEAAIGMNQLARIESNIDRREAIWKMYDQAFQDLPVTTPAPVHPGIRHARHLYTLLINIDELDITRDEVILALKQENIGAGVHFVSLHLHSYYRKTYGFRPQDYPQAFHVSERTISLPFSSALSDEDVVDVITALQKIMLGARSKNVF